MPAIRKRQPQQRKSTALVKQGESTKGNSRYLNSSVMGSLTRTIERHSMDREEIMLHIELYLNNRQKNGEHIRLGEMLRYWKEDLSDRQRGIITYEDLCERYNIDHPLMIAAIAGGFAQANLSVAKMKIALAAPDVVEAVVKRAVARKGGTKDSEMILKATGILTTDAAIQINAIGQQNNSQVNVGVAVNVPNFRAEIMDIDEMIRDAHEKARLCTDNEVILEGELIEDENGL